MRKYRNTTLIILLLALPCFGQFTEIWTNGDYFAVDQMASQCYSASVERCLAAGVTPDSPSWYDYLLGKNHAKLVSVKNNISNIATNYVPASYDVLSLLNSNYPITWTSKYSFVYDCGLPTNALDENPWFKTQYPDTTGGWRNVYIMLTNMLKTASSGKYEYLNNLSWLGVGIGSDNWTDDVAFAESIWGYYGEVAWQDKISPLSYWWGIYDSMAYVASVEHNYNAFGYTLNTNAVMTKKTTAYCIGEDMSKAILAIGGFDTNDTVFTYDSQGYPITNGVWSEHSFYVTNAATCYPFDFTARGDSTNDPGIPPNSDADPFNYGVTNRFTGFRISDQRIVHDWIYSTNGFKYR